MQLPADHQYVSATCTHGSCTGLNLFLPDTQRNREVAQWRADQHERKYEDHKTNVKSVNVSDQFARHIVHEAYF